MNNKETTYFFVDESGDPKFFNKYRKNIVGIQGCSKILILGLIRTFYPNHIRKEISKLLNNIAQDEYLLSIPSINKTITKGFHAKDDTPEVREKFYKLIKTLDFKAEFLVARKDEKIFKKRHKGKENLFYDEMIIKLFQNKLHKTKNNKIYFAIRGNKKRQIPLEEAINTAKLTFEKKWNKEIDSDCEIIPQSPVGEPCLQIIDYMNWAVYRAFNKAEERYFNYVKEKVSLLVDIYDYKNYPNNFYNRRNKFSVKKISPL
jgi:hypothetical protein